MENTTKFYEIILDCPFNDPLSDCTFNRFRKMAITDLIETMHQMKPAELNDLLEQHQECVKKRGQRKLAS